MFYSLHGFRGIAALSVLLFHWGSSIGFFSFVQSKAVVYIFGVSLSVLTPLNFGWLGVPIFFILSAVLLSTNWLEQPLTAKPYFIYIRRRLLRIFPAYWLQLIILLAVGPLLGLAYSFDSVGEFLRHAALLINTPPWMDKPLNPVWWTLPVEFSFYLVLPFIIIAYRRLPVICLLFSGLLVTLLWRWLIFEYYQVENYGPYIYVLDSLPGVLFTFCVGIAVALNPSLGGWVASKWLGLYLPLLVFMALMILLKSNLSTYWSGGNLLLLWPACVAASLGVVVAHYRCSKSLVLESRPVQFLGDISFGLYLWHYPVLQYLKVQLSGFDATWFLAVFSLLLTLIISMLLAYASYRLVEKPCMGLFRDKTKP